MPANNRIEFQLDFKTGDIKALSSLKKDLAEIQRLAGDIDFTGDKSISEIQSMTNAARTLENALNQAFDPNLNTINIQKFNNILAQSGYNAQTLQAGLAQAGVTGQQAFLKLTGQLMQFNTATKQTNKFLDGIATSLFNTIKWSAMSSIVNNIAATVQKSYYYVKDLDRSLNDIRIVTNKSAEDMGVFAEKANEAAKALAVTTEDYTQGSLIYYQQGLDDTTVETLTDITAKTSNVTQQSMSTVSEQLTAVWNGYQVANRAAEEGMQVYEEYVDKMAAVGASTASDLEELSTAMSKVASAASSMGVDFDDLNAQIATIVSVTRQAPESVGTALKTIYARLGDLKVDGVDEFGTKLGEVSAQLQTMGINIIDQQGNMRNMSDVIAEVAEKWDTWTSAQRQAAAVAMAGKRQYNNLIALFDNQDMYGEALETSMNAAGTLEKQQEIAMDSLANKMDVLKATAEDLYDSLFNTDTISDFLDAGTGVLQFFADFTDSIGGLNNLLPMLGSIGLQVFSEQIGRGLSTVIINARNARAEAEMMESNFQAIQAMHLDSILFSGDSTSQAQLVKEQVGQIKSYYEEMYQYQKIMNTEQKDQYNTLLNSKIKIGEMSVDLEQQRENQKNINGVLNLIDGNLIDEKKNTQAIVGEIDKVNKIAKELEGYLSKVNNPSWAGFLGVLKSLDGELTIESSKVKQLGEMFTQLTEKGHSTEEALAIIIRRLQNVGENAGQIIKLENEINNLTSYTKTAGDALKDNLSTQSFVSNISSTVGMLGQLSMSIQTLKNLGNIQDNEDISNGEKFLQIVMNLSFAFPGLMKGASAYFNLLKNNSSAIRALTQYFGKLRAEKELNNLADVTGLETSKLLQMATTKESLTTQLARQAEYEYAKAHGIGQSQISAETKALIQETAAKRAEAVITQKATLEQEKLNIALSSNVVGIAIVALTALVGVLFAVDAHYKKVAESAKEAAEESKKVADQLNAEAESHQKLIDEFDELNQQYKDGLIEKEALQDVTDKLIDAYGLETNIVDKLTGNYDALASAAKRAREEEEAEALFKTKQSIRDTGEAIRKDTRKEGQQFTQLKLSGEGGGPNEIGYGTPDDVKRIRKEIFGEEVTESGYFHFDTSTTAGIVEAVEKLDAYILKMEEAGYTEEDFNLKNIKIQRDLYKNSEQYQNAADSIELYKKQLLEFSNLDIASTQEEFNKGIEQLKADFQEGMNLGYISSMSSDELDSYILKYVSKLNTVFSEKFALDAIIEKKFGPELVDKFSKYSPEIVNALLASGFDLSLVSIENVDDLIKNFQTSIENNPNAVVSIPAAFQLDINEKILGGKDIAKDDQETLLASNYNAEAILGDRESFNNKSIGERIALMQQLNAVTLAQNRNAIENYDILKKTNDELINEAEREIELKTSQLKRDSSYIEYLKATSTQQELSKEEQDALIQKIKDTKNEIEQLTDKKYELEIELNLESITDNLVQSVVGEVITSADQVKAAAESIGEGQKVAAEDVATFAAAFPELMEGVKRQADGSLQLSKEIVNAELEGAQQRIDANKQVAIQAAEDKIKQLKLEVQFKEEQEKILTEALEGEKTAAEVKTELADATFDYQQQLLDNGLIAQADALTKSQIQEQTAVDGMINILQGLNDSINIIHQNFANMLTTDVDMIDLSATAGAVKEITASSVDTNKLNNNGFSTADIDAMIKARDQLRKEISQEKTQIASYEGFISDMNKRASDMDKAADRVKKGLAGKEDKSKSGGSKKDKDKDQKEQEDEFDRYQEIKKAIDAVDQALKKLDKDQENLFGYELIASLKQENELLEQQAANYNTLYEMQQQEAAELREQLGTMGLMFDASGAITNYAAATSAALQAYAAAIEQYNAGLIDETTLGVYEKSYENFKKLLQRYDTLYYKEMQDTQDKIDEIHRQELANNLKAQETEIQIHLDMEKAKRDQNEFLKDITKDFRKVYQDLTIDVNYDEDNFKSIVNDVNTTIRAIHDVQSEIDKMMSGGTSDMFESVSQAQEKLKKLQEELLSQGKDLYALYKAVWEAYLEGMDQVKDQFDELMNKYKRFDNELKFQKELIELLYGDKAYELMDKYYKVQEQNILAQIESLRKQTSMQESEFQKSYQNAIKNGSKVDIDDFTTWTEDMKRAYENMIESQEDLNDLILEAVKILQDQYLNSINKIMDAMDKEIWGKDGFEGMKKNQEFMQKMADEYLDAVEGGAKIQLFANRIDMDKANTSNLKAQQKLQAFRDKEIKDLREKENLTQADIDLAEARYQIMLKEIALEDAQNNKTSMKLTRNEQGNQSYQYVADEDEVGQKQQDLLQSYSDLYKLADDSFAHSMELAFDLYEEVRDRIREIAEDTTLTEEEKNRKIAEIQKQYSEQINIALGNAELYRQEAMQATAGVFQTICEQDASAYETLTEEQKRMVDELKDLHFEDYNEMRDHLKEDFLPSVKEVFEEMNINSQTTAAQFLKDQVKDPNSVKNSMIKAVSEIQKAIQEYEKELDKLQQIADMDFSKIGESIDKVSKKIEDMGGTTDRMVDNSSQYLDELRRTLEAVASTWDSVIEKILESQRAMQEYINLAAQARAASNAGSGGNTGGGGIPPVGGGNGSGDNGNKAPEGPGGKGERFGIIAQDGHHNVDTRIDSAGEKGLTLDEAHNLYSNNKMLQGAEGLSNFRFQNLDKNAGFPAYKTGGYTGAWNDSDGRLAMLHQKELVLNADDTENFLSGISMIRDMTSMNGSISKAITNAVGNMVYALNNTSIGVRTNPAAQEAAAYNTYNITAEFPNANDVNEIREAILSLPNLASQYIGRNIK